jgi:tRNA G18 (ribose-2'-O)-methylase SpoU
MLQARVIDSLDLPELQPYRTMRRQMEHRQQGLFVAEGEKVVRRLLESRLTVLSALLPTKWFEELQPLLTNRPEMVQVFVAEKELLETLTGFSMYQGLLAVAQVPQQPSLEDLLQRSASPRLFAAVEGLSNADNLGAVVRNCAAFGVQGLITGPDSCSPFLRRAVRSSMGTVFQLPIVEAPCVADSLKLLRTHGIRCIAAHPHAEGRTPPRAGFTGDCCIVFGSEGYGLSEAALRNCEESAAIPMAPPVDSLNVGSAAAVFLYEASRQRGRM